MQRSKDLTSVHSLSGTLSSVLEARLEHVLDHRGTSRVALQLVEGAIPASRRRVRSATCVHDTSNAGPPACAPRQLTGARHRHVCYSARCMSRLNGLQCAVQTAKCLAALCASDGGRMPVAGCHFAMVFFSTHVARLAAGYCRIRKDALYPVCKVATADRLLARPNHGIPYGAQHHHSQTGPPAPPAMTAQTNPPAPSPYGYDAARRPSLNGGSPPNPYRGKAPLSHAQRPVSS